jgi:hypothetical protein
VVWIVVLVGILIDLGFGVQKAKQIGEFITSEGFRRTVKKLTYYYSMLTFALLFDSINPISYYFPYPLSVIPLFTVIFGMVLIYTEAKSVREKAEDKLRRKTDASIGEFIEAFKNNKEILGDISTFLQNEKNKQDEQNNSINNSDSNNGE